MITLLIAENEEKVKEIVSRMLSKAGNSSLGIIKQADSIKILDQDNLKDMVTLKDKIIELEESLYQEKKGALYKCVLEVIEKPLIEYILERTGGNKLKTAKILGFNRNTLHGKIKRLGINVDRWKVI